MSFAFHKLYPRLIELCPDLYPCTPITGTTTIYTPGVCSPCSGGAGQGTVGGSNCIGSLMDDTGDVTYPGCPKEFRLSGGLPHPCQLTNTQNGWDNIRPELRDPGTWYSKIGYYYRTPSSPNQTPGTYGGTPLCIEHTTYTIHDRAMIISGRNRYRYAGWLVDPTYDSSIPKFWSSVLGAEPNEQNVFLGIKELEESINDGRTFPASDAVLNYPLWGAQTSQNPQSGNINACGQSTPCTDPVACFTCRNNDSVGHFLPSNQGNGNGYLSFQCFNPDAYFMLNGYGNDATIECPIPTCSVWSLVRAMFNAVKSAWLNFTGGAFSFEQVFAAINQAYNNLISSDPSGLQGQKSNVRYYLEQFATELSNMTPSGDAFGFEETPWTFVIPNVFLWDRAAYNAATGSDKWKHLYVIGNGNILFDSGCISVVNGKRSLLLDEVTHDPTPDSAFNARVIQFFGCNDKRTDNSSSIQKIGINVAPCQFESDPNSDGWCIPCNGDAICAYERTVCPTSSNDPYEPYDWDSEGGGGGGGL